MGHREAVLERIIGLYPGFPMLRLTAFEFRDRARELVVDVKPWGQGGRCPECQRRGEGMSSTPSIREWRDVSV